jgi:hypothetical protein
MPFVLPLVAAVRSVFRSRAALELEILALRHLKIESAKALVNVFVIDQVAKPNAN